MAERTTPLGKDGEMEVEVLVADIEKTRTEMTETVQAIEQKLSPARLKESIKETVRMELDNAKTAVRTATVGRAENMFETAVDTIKTNPVPAALTGIGLVWMVMSRRAQHRRYVEYGYEGYELGEPGGGFEEYEGEGLREKARRTVGRSRGKVKELAHEAKDRTRELASDARVRTRELANEAKVKTREFAHRARNMEHRFEDSVRENPLAYAAVALAIGTAVGLAIPRSNIEDRYLGEARDRLVGRAEDAAHEALATVEPAPEEESIEFDRPPLH